MKRGKYLGDRRDTSIYKPAVSDQLTHASEACIHTVYTSGTAKVGPVEAPIVENESVHGP
jgi:hypothetical protein